MCVSPSCGGMFPVDAWDSNLRLQWGDIPEFTQIARRSRQSCSGRSSGIPGGSRSTHTLPTSFFGAPGPQLSSYVWLLFFLNAYIVLFLTSFLLLAFEVLPSDVAVVCNHPSGL